MRHRVCPNCKNPLPIEAPLTRVYCNDACKQEAWRKKHRIAKAKSGNLRKAFCLNCGKRFETNQPHKLFCKDSCRVSHWQQQKRLAVKEGN